MTVVPEETQQSAAKAKAMAEALEKRQTDSYNKMEKLDLKEAHKRCFEGGNSGAVTITGA
jgi:hypothetical protein